jgi:hypothetical protein
LVVVVGLNFNPTNGKFALFGICSTSLNITIEFCA